MQAFQDKRIVTGLYVLLRFKLGLDCSSKYLWWITVISVKFFFLFLLIVFGQFVTAQIPSPSPLGVVEQIIGNTKLTVSYERPSARGRILFGKLVPFHQVWRTGAGHCTKLSFSKPVTIGRQAVPAGKYALLTIPGPNEWTVILNADTTLYGSKDYDRTKDVVRFRVPSHRSDRFYESLTIDVEIILDNGLLYLSWGNTQINFFIETTTSAVVNEYVNHLLTSPLSEANDYVWAAEHLLLQRGDLGTVKRLIDLQMRVVENEYAWRILMELNDYLGYTDRALAAAKNALAYRKAHPLDEQNQAWSVSYWLEEIKQRQH